MIKNFKSYRRAFILTLAFFTAMIILFATTSSNTKPYAMKDSVDYRKSYYSSALSYANQCGHIYTYEEYEKISFAVPESYFNDIPSSPDIVPMYGYIAQAFLPKEKVGFYSPKTVNRNWSENYILSTMWNLDTVVVWYDEKQVTNEELKDLKAIADKFTNQILILPWLGYDSETLPVKRKFAFASMGASQSCNKFNFIVLLEFLAFLKKNGHSSHSDFAQLARMEDGVLIELPIDKSTGK